MLSFLLSISKTCHRKAVYGHYRYLVLQHIPDLISPQAGKKISLLGISLCPFFIPIDHSGRFGTRVVSSADSEIADSNLGWGNGCYEVVHNWPKSAGLLGITRFTSAVIWTCPSLNLKVVNI